MNATIAFNDHIYFLPTYIAQYNPCPSTGNFFYTDSGIGSNGSIKYGDYMTLNTEAGYLSVYNDRYIMSTDLENVTQWTIGIYPGTTPQNPPYVTTGDKVTFTTNIGGIIYYINNDSLCTEPYCESQCILVGRYASVDKNAYVYVYDASYDPVYYGASINFSPDANNYGCPSFQISPDQNYNPNPKYPYVISGDVVNLFDVSNQFYLTVSTSSEYPNLIEYSTTPTPWTISEHNGVYNNTQATLSTTGVGGSLVYINVTETSPCNLIGTYASTSPVSVYIHATSDNTANNITNNTTNNTTNNMKNNVINRTKNIVPKQLPNNENNWSWLWVLLIVIALIILFWYLYQNNQKHKRELI